MNSLVAFLLSSSIVFVVLSHEANEENLLKELTTAGVSEETANGIIAIGQKHIPDGSNPDLSGKDIFESIIRETDEYLKGRPESDQHAYASFVADKKAQYEKPEEVDGSNDAGVAVEEPAQPEASVQVQ